MSTPNPHPELVITEPETVEVPVTWELENPQDYADSRAKALAAERDRPIIVKLAGVYSNTSEKADPPERSNDVMQTAEGAAEVETQQDQRSASEEYIRATEVYGLQTADDDEDQPAVGLSSALGNFVTGISRGNAPRDISGLISSLEAVMMDLPNEILNKFTQFLPPGLRSLLPLGEIAGILTKGPISLNSLIRAIGGTALGQFASDALRTAIAAENALSNLSQLLSSTAIPDLITEAGQALQETISNQLQNLDLSNILQASQLVSQLSTEISAIAQRLVIPLSQDLLATATGIVLRNITTNLNIPLNIVGQGLNAVNAISQILNKVTGGFIPIIPSNLSIPNLIASGIARNLPPQIAETLFTPTQIANLLPANLRNQIPRVPARVTGSPYIQNRVGAARQAAPEQASEGRTISGGPAGEPTHQPQPALATGSGGRIDYAQKISANYTLASVSTNTVLQKRRIIPQNRLTVDQIIKNLSLVAVNILEPIRANYPGFYITSGFRTPGGSSDHRFGRAVDIQWGSKSSDEVFEIAHWIRDNLVFYQLIFEHGNKIWLHIAYREGDSTRKTNTWHRSLAPNYPRGLRNFYSGRR